MIKEKDIEQLAKDERNEYFRKYRAAHPEKVKKSNANYWKKKAIAKLNDKSDCL